MTDPLEMLPTDAVIDGFQAWFGAFERWARRRVDSPQKLEGEQTAWPIGIQDDEVPALSPELVAAWRHVLYCALEGKNAVIAARSPSPAGLLALFKCYQLHGFLAGVMWRGGNASLDELRPIGKGPKP